jgi:hypothetical protein
MMLRFAVALVRLWTRVFTIGMPATVREWRRAEIQSDLWEQAHDGPASGWQLVGRLLRGIPADVIWRVEEETLRSRAVVAVAATLVVAAAAGALWAIDLMRADVLPTPPPIWVNVAAPPPPPPPPPPPGDGYSAR